MNINTRMEDLNTVKEAVGSLGESFYKEILEGIVLRNEKRPVGLYELVDATNLIRFYEIKFVSVSDAWIEKRFQHITGDKVFEIRIKSDRPDKFFMSEGSKALNTKALKRYHVKFSDDETAVDVPSYFVKNFTDLPSL